MEDPRLGAARRVFGVSTGKVKHKMWKLIRTKPHKHNGDPQRRKEFDTPVLESGK